MQVWRGLAFVLAAWVLAPGAPGAVATDRSLESWLLVRADGAVLLVQGPPDLDEPEVAEGSWQAAWVWSRNAGPRRIAWSDVQDDDAPRQEGDQKGQGLRVVLAGVELDTFSDLELIAAPVDMWKEVAEEHLPRWPVERDGSATIPRQDGTVPWRLRAIGPELGSWWVEVPPGTPRSLVGVAAAEDLVLRVVGSKGQGIEGVALHLQESHGDRLGAPQGFGHQRTDAAGSVVWPSLPDAGPLRILAVTGGFVPAALEGRPPSLPRTWRLEVGLHLAGRVVDGDGRPVSGAEIEWITQPRDFPAAWRLQAISDPGGAWEIRGVPGGRASATVRKEGLGVLELTVDLPTVAEDPVRLPDWVVEAGVEAELRVVDDAGLGVAGASVRSPFETRTSDEEGWVRLTNVSRTGRLELRLEAPGHLPTPHLLVPPHGSVREVVLPRGAVLRGRLVDSAGDPVPGGRIKIEDCDTWEQSSTRTDASFELLLVPGRTYEVVFSSPTTDATRRSVPALAAGEVIELGDVGLPAGRTLRGRLVAAADGRPLAGARLWTPRQAEDPLASWVRRDLVEARSAADGTFVLRGLPEWPAALRVEAPGMAPLRRSLQFPPDELDLDLGDLEVESGLILQLRSEGFDAKGSVARLDLVGEWRELDLVEAPLLNGVARFSGLPMGSFEVVVMRDREVLCRRRIALEEEWTEATCRQGRQVVRGEVTAGGRSAGPGELVWLPASRGGSGIVIRREAVPGVGRSSAYGASLPQVEVPVDEQGRYTTDRLSAGRWRVVWRDARGATSQPLAINVPESAEPTLRIELPGLELRGEVTTPDGRPVAAARVRLLEGGALSFTDEDGRFGFVGLAPGRYHLRAEYAGSTSSVEAVEVTEPIDGLRLVIGETDPSPGIRLTVSGPGGQPAAGALVVVQWADQQRLLTAGGDGGVVLWLDPPWPEHLRAAAWTPDGWSLGPWTEWSEAMDDGLVLAVGDVGGLRFVGDPSRPAEVSSVRTATGWDVVSLLRRLGRSPVADGEGGVAIQGLPVGTYLVGGGSGLVPTEVRKDRLETLSGF